MKYLKPEMDIVEFDERVWTGVYSDGEFDNTEGEGGTLPNFPTIPTN